MSTVEFPQMEDPQVEEVRDEMILLSTRGKIKYTEKFLKKANSKQLIKIKYEYDRQQTEIVDDLVTKHVINALASTMKSFKYIDGEQCEEMKHTLLDNDLIKRDLGELSGYLTRNIKYIGVAGGYVISKKYGKQTKQTTTVEEDRQNSE